MTARKTLGSLVFLVLELDMHHSLDYHVVCFIECILLGGLALND